MPQIRGRWLVRVSMVFGGSSVRRGLDDGVDKARHSPLFGTVMSDEISMSTVLPSTNAADAYASDLTRLCRSGPVGPNDDAWLILAHAFSRFEAMPDETLARAAGDVADVVAIDALAGMQPAQPKLLRVSTALRGLCDGLGNTDSEGTCDEVVIAARAVIEEMELAGAFGLAYASLHGVLGAFGHRISGHTRGGVLAHQGRALRQLGHMDFARSLYEAAQVVGEESNAPDIVSRAFLGLGILGVSRGNYPQAREEFARALEQADRANDAELIRNSHHGLMNCCLASGDLDSALVHGWNVLRLCISPDSRAEALMNLAEVCRLTGELDAAMRVFAVAMEWTSNRSVRLHAASSALHVAVTLDRLPEARRYAAEITDLLPTVTDVYTRANLCVEVADSLHRLGEIAAAEEMMLTSTTLASTHSFYEVAHRADQVKSGWAAQVKSESSKHADSRRRRPQRSEGFRTVLRSLKGLTAAAL